MSDEEEIVISVNGVSYGGWKAAAALSSIDAVCGSFDVSLMDRWGEMKAPMEIHPGDACQVLLGDEPVITGYVDSVSPSITASDHSIAISGRDKTADLVDCSTDINAYELIGLKLDEIAKMICQKFGINVLVNTNVGEAFERFAIQPGESAFSCLERAAKLRGVLLTTNGDGALAISAKGVFPATGDAIIEGKNILSGSAVYDWKDRFSDYTVHGQMPAFDDGADDPAHNQIGNARDVNVMRYRPLILTSESWATLESARIRAENECAWRAGKATRVNVQVPGWRQSNGSRWMPGIKTAATSRSLYIPDNTELVVSSVRYSFSDSDGRIAELELTRPDAYMNNCSGAVEVDPYES